MEVTAAERTAIYTNISPLAQRVNLSLIHISEPTRP